MPLGTVPSSHWGRFRSARLLNVPLGTVPFDPFVNLFNYLKGAWVPPLCFRSFEQLFPEWGEKRENLVYLRMVVAEQLRFQL